MRTVTANDRKSQLELIWRALECYREDCISGDEHQEEWDDICTIMAWWTEDFEKQDDESYSELD